MKRQEREDGIFQRDFQKKLKIEVEVQEWVREAEIAVLSLSKAEKVLPPEMKSALEQIKNLKKSWQKVHEATEKVLAEYLTLTERKILKDFKSKMGERENLEKLMKEIELPTETQVRDLQAYEEIVQSLGDKMRNLAEELEKIRPKVLEVERKLDKVGRRKNIQQAIHNNLQSNVEKLEQLKTQTSAFLESIKKLDQDEATKDPIKRIFHFSEVESIVKQQYVDLKAQYEKKVGERNALKLKVISASRTIEMAKNAFVRGGFKELRAKENQFRKLSKKYEREWEKYQRQVAIFKATDWQDNGQRIQSNYYLTKDKIRLEGIQRKIRMMSKQINIESADLEKRCGTPEAHQKIGLIAAGILRKNLKYAREYGKAKESVKELSKSIQLFKKRLSNLKENVPRKMKSCYYQVTSADNSPSTLASLASVIADALNHEPAAMAQVLCSSGDNLEMEKDWKLMTVFDKAELIRKKMIREL